MKRIRMLTMALALAPAVAFAQAQKPAKAPASTAATSQPRGTSAAAQAKASANAEASFNTPKGWSADGAAKLEATYAAAKSRDLPREPIAHRVAEGSAKGASQTTILASAGKMESNMEATQDAMVAAGRPHPSPEECERGAMLMERGVTKAQIETMTKRTPSDRSLVVAFDVLGRLAARGVPVTQALTQVQAKLDARASDQAIISLAGKGGPPMANGTPGTANGIGVATSAAGSVTGTTKGATAGVAGAVTGVVKRP